MRATAPRKYNEDFVRYATRKVTQPNAQIAAVARELQMPKQTLAKWKEKALLADQTPSALLQEPTTQYRENAKITLTKLDSGFVVQVTQHDLVTTVVFDDDLNQQIQFVSDC